MARRRMPPFETEITHLGPKGVGVGLAPDGLPVHVRGVPVGSRVAVMVVRKKKGVWPGRRGAVIRPAPDAVPARCAVFGLCGGCTLQEMGLEAQHRAKEALIASAVGPELGRPVEKLVHRMVPGSTAFGYRNKVELTFGSRQYLRADALDSGVPIDGTYLGFHAPGRWDRIVDTTHCALVSEPMNALLTTVRNIALPSGRPAWNPRSHSGFWRHLLLREARATGERLVGLYTAPAQCEEDVAAARAVAERVAEHATGVFWAENASVADVAQGEVRERWGREHIEERLGDCVFQLSASSFFQTSTAGAETLYGVVGRALEGAETLLDLYCGAGTIGIFLAHRFPRIIGVEERAEAVADARQNATRNNVNATYHLGRMEKQLGVLAQSGAAIVVDPPRAGLHPKVAEALGRIPGHSLAYVACNPASLGRDGAILERGGWRLTDIWPVDLFPQTGHVEAVGRFVRSRKVALPTEPSATVAS